MENTGLSLYEWIQKKAAITFPYKKHWSASVTLGGVDVNETGDTIQKAYKALQQRIESSEFLFKAFANLK